MEEPCGLVQLCIDTRNDVPGAELGTKDVNTGVPVKDSNLSMNGSSGGAQLEEDKDSVKVSLAHRCQT